jgi:hypothetical protein
MSEFFAILKDISTGALPLVAIPSFIVWLISHKKTAGAK